MLLFLPSGTRIIYDRKFLLQCRTSPLTRTPPKLPDIPGVTSPIKPESTSDTNHSEPSARNSSPHTEEHAGNTPSACLKHESERRIANVCFL